MDRLKLSFIYRIIDSNDNILFVGHVFNANTHNLLDIPSVITALSKLRTNTSQLPLRSLITHTLYSNESTLLRVKYNDINKLSKQDIYEHIEL
jgi:hypothetical protein